MQNTSFIRLHAKYRERGDVLTRYNHKIMRAISAAFRFILAFYSAELSVVVENIKHTIISKTTQIILFDL